MQTVDVVLADYSSIQSLRKALESIEYSIKDDIMLRRVIIINNRAMPNLSNSINSLLPIKILHLRDVGYAASLNIGFNSGGAEYTAFISDNAEFSPNTFESALSRIDDITEIIGFATEKRNGFRCSKMCKFPGPFSLSFKKNGLKRGGDFIYSSFFIIKSDIFAQHHGFNRKLDKKYAIIDFFKKLRSSNIRIDYCESISVKLNNPLPRTNGFKDALVSVRSRLAYCVSNYHGIKYRISLFVLLRIEPFLLMLSGFNRSKEMRLAYKAVTN